MRKWLISLMVVCSIVLAGGVAFLYMTRDTKGPEISFESGKNQQYEDGMSTEELLENVKAMDDKDGDVSDTLAVENIYTKGTDKVVVVYVAKDNSNNVTKKEMTMSTEGTDTEEETEMSDIPTVSDGEETQESDGEGADQMSDTEDTDTLTDDAQKTEGSDMTETPDVTPGLTEDNPEEEARKTQEDKITLLSPQAPRFYLTTYYTEVAVGTAIDQLSFVKDIQDDVDERYELFKHIMIEGSVDTNTPGTYELTYYALDTNGNSSNAAVLTVVVK